MKKLIITMLAAVGIMLSGCTPDENTLASAAQTAGTIGMLTWFSIDNPDPQGKATLKEVIGEGDTYLESLLPYVQKFVGEQEKLTDYQKQLINAGSVVILNGIDTFMASNSKVKENAELGSRVVSSFCKGCLVVLNMPEDCDECKRAREVYQMRNMKCRGGKFVTEK